MGTALILLILAAELVLLVGDIPLVPSWWYPTRSARPNSDRIGEVGEMRRAVQVQSEGEILWEPVQGKSVLYRKQALLTGSGARAEVVFDDGTGVQIGENTWVELERRSDGPGFKLRLRRGSIATTGKGSKLFAVELGTGTVVLEPGSVAVFQGVTRSQTEPQAQILSGSAQIALKDQAHTVQMKAGEKALFNTNPPTFSQDGLVIVKPSEGAVIRAGSNTLEVQWRIDRARAPTSAMRLEASYDPQFADSSQASGSAQVPLSEPPPEKITTKITLKPSPLAGSGESPLYFRVRAQRAGVPIVSDTRQVWVDWTGVEVAAPPSVDKTKANKPAPEIYPAKEAVPAKPAAPIKKKKSPPPPPDDLDADVKKTKGKMKKKVGHSWLHWLIPTADAAEATETPDATSATAADFDENLILQIKWGAVDGALGYRVQLAHDREFKELLAETDVQEPGLSWPVPVALAKDAGAEIYYRVASKGDDGEVGGYSKPKPMTLPQPPPLSSWGTHFALHTGLGNQFQSSADAGLTSVALQRVFFQQKAQASLGWSRETAKGGELWLALLEFWIAGFHRPDTAVTTGQPNVAAWNARLDLQRWSVPKRTRSPWSWGIGATWDRSYRWVKTSPQVLDPQGTFALGPSAGLMRNWGWTARWLPRQSEVALQIPLSGVLYGGQWGVSGTLASEWSIIKLAKNWLAVRLEFSASHLRWNSPSGTGRTDWAIWLAPTYSLGSL